MSFIGLPSKSTLLNVLSFESTHNIYYNSQREIFPLVALPLSFLKWSDAFFIIGRETRYYYQRVPNYLDHGQRSRCTETFGPEN
jgi:hypothetical protein